MAIVEGLALYLRKIDPKRHGSPGELASKCKGLGLSWLAIAGPWQEPRSPGGPLKTGMINAPEVCRAYADALDAVGVTPYVWGYPWQGGEQEFVQQLLACAGPRGLVLLDPELGSNPSRSPQPGPMQRAEQHAQTIVSGLLAGGAKTIGLSTFGVVPRWFPLRAFLRAGIHFAGGQTYTDDATVNTSVASFLNEFKAVERSDVQLIPNFGLYSWADGAGDAKARPKTSDELRSHLMHFIDEGEPVHAMIGWAENFLNKGLEPELSKFAELMRRGATALPPKTT